MIDLLVVNFNTQQLLERLVNTLCKTTPNDQDRQWRLFVADNNSEDESRDWINQNESLFDGIYFNENIGYAKAINMMAAKTDSDILAALNADVWFTNDDINAIQNQFDTNQEIAILGPKQRNEAGRITHGGILDIFGKPTHRGWNEYDIADQLYRFIDQVGTVSGSAYFVRRTVWNELANCPLYRDIDPDSQGAFLQTPHYYEETFCSVHAQAHGHKVFYDGTVSMGHSWHKSSPVGGRADQYFSISRNFFIEACKHHNIPLEEALR